MCRWISWRTAVARRAGDYIYTISAVDIATNWWEGQAIAVRSQRAAKEGLSQMRNRGVRFASANCIRTTIRRWSTICCGIGRRQEKIRLSRSRPYKKNDNAWVEQKNWTHVRKVVGYRRFDTTGELRLLNEIYAVLRLYKNFCLPDDPAEEQGTRVEGRIKRVYDKPCTPYQRILASKQIDRKTKRELRSVYDSLNVSVRRNQGDQIRAADQRLGVSRATSESFR